MTMKMIKFGVAIIGVLMSSTLLAADMYKDTTADLVMGTVDPADCSALRDAAKVNLSTGVIAALNCRSIIGDGLIGTCHSKGNVKPSSVNCSCNDISTTAIPNYQMNISTCPGSCDSGGNYVQSAPPAIDSVLVAGRKAFGASTGGGQLTSYSLGDTGLCDAANLKKVSLFP